MQTNCDRAFVLSIEKSVAGSFAEVMSYDCMSVRLVDGCVVVGVTPLLTKRDGRWGVESSRSLRSECCLRLPVHYN